MQEEFHISPVSEAECFKLSTIFFYLGQSIYVFSLKNDQVFNKAIKCLKINFVTCFFLQFYSLETQRFNEV